MKCTHPNCKHDSANPRVKIYPNGLCGRHASAARRKALFTRARAMQDLCALVEKLAPVLDAQILHATGIEPEKFADALAAAQRSL